LQMLWTTWGQLLLRHFLPGRSGGGARIAAAGSPKLPDHELRLRGACGKERTGFPQADAAQPSEIPHPVDPETWKRCYTFILTCSSTTNDSIWCNLYWLRARTLPRLLPGGECSKAKSVPQGTEAGG